MLVGECRDYRSLDHAGKVERRDVLDGVTLAAEHEAGGILFRVADLRGKELEPFVESRTREKICRPDLAVGIECTTDQAEVVGFEDEGTNFGVDAVEERFGDAEGDLSGMDCEKQAAAEIGNELEIRRRSIVVRVGELLLFTWGC